MIKTKSSVDCPFDTMLLNKVIRQMQRDFDNQDVTAIERLLMFVPIKHLEGYLSEVDYDKTK